MDVRYPRPRQSSKDTTTQEPWLRPDEARRDYESDRGLTVQSAEVRPDGNPAWDLWISPTRSRFHLIFRGDLGTPLRDVQWHTDDRGLVLRRTLDVFYPDGDPGARIAYDKATTVVREYSTDGHAQVALRTPGGDDIPRLVHGVRREALTRPVPAFGDWADLVEASAPDVTGRYGAAAPATARAHADADPVGAAAKRGRRPHSDGWLFRGTERHVLTVVNAAMAGTEIPHGATVLTRGEARIIPLGVQASLSSACDPAEEQRRMRSLADDVRGLLSHQAGEPMDFLNWWNDSDATARYAAQLKAAGVTDAWSWVYGRNWDTGVVRAWSGDGESGTLMLALHVVPAHWVSDRRPGEPGDVDLRWSRADLEGAPG